MKRKIAALIVLATMLLTFAGCSNTKSIPDTDNSRTIELAGPVIEDLDGKVLVDANDIKITAHEITFEEGSAAGVYLNITNGTDKDLCFQTRNVSVNDCMMDSILSGIVGAGTKKDVSLLVEDRNLSQYGIVAIEQIEFNFYVFDADTHEEYMTSDPVCIELESKGDAAKADDTNENVLYEDNGIRVVELLDEEYTKDAFEYTSVVRVENNTEYEIVVMTDYPDECSVYLFAQVPAGKAGVADAILRNSYYVEEENADLETEVLETPEKTVEISFTISGVDEPIHVDGAALTMRSHGEASLVNQ